MYAGPRTYESNNRDLFSSARLALEFFLEHEGNLSHFELLTKFSDCLLIIKRMVLLGILPTGGCSTTEAFEGKLDSLSQSCDKSVIG